MPQPLLAGAFKPLFVITLFMMVAGNPGREREHGRPGQAISGWVARLDSRAAKTIGLNLHGV
jgi:hypothetical protein